MPFPRALRMRQALGPLQKRDFSPISNFSFSPTLKFVFFPFSSFPEFLKPTSPILFHDAAEMEEHCRYFPILHFPFSNFSFVCFSLFKILTLLFPFSNFSFFRFCLFQNSQFCVFNLFKLGLEKEPLKPPTKKN